MVNLGLIYCVCIYPCLINGIDITIKNETNEQLELRNYYYLEG